MSLTKKQAVAILKSREVFEGIDKRPVKVQHVHLYTEDETPRWIVSLSAMSIIDAMKAKKYLKGLDDDAEVDNKYLQNFSVSVFKQDQVPVIGSRVIVHTGFVKDRENNTVLRATGIEAIPMSASKKLAWDDEDEE